MTILKVAEETAFIVTEENTPEPLNGPIGYGYCKIEPDSKAPLSICCSAAPVSMLEGSEGHNQFVWPPSSISCLLPPFVQVPFARTF